MGALLKWGLFPEENNKCKFRFHEKLYILYPDNFFFAKSMYTDMCIHCLFRYTLKTNISFISTLLKISDVHKYLWKFRFCYCIYRETLYKSTVTDNYASAKVAPLHPLKRQFWKNPYIPNERPLSTEQTTTPATSVSHLTGEIFTFKN